MGTGIMAAVPLVFEPHKSYGKQDKLEKRYFSKEFFSNFDFEETESGVNYFIKKDLLLTNYKQFLLEFYDVIEEDFKYETDIDPEEIPIANNFEEFENIFEAMRRNRQVPFIDNGIPRFSGFEVVGCECTKYWLFYDGSYKAYLEVYSTLLHFEKILVKAMNNPLANAVKFGIFG